MSGREHAMPVAVQVNHDDLGRRTESRREQHRKPDWPWTYDGDVEAHMDVSVQYDAREAGPLDRAKLAARRIALWRRLRSDTVTPPTAVFAFNAVCYIAGAAAADHARYF